MNGDCGFGLDAGGYGAEPVGDDVLERLLGRAAVDGVYHYLARADAAVGPDERVDFGIGGVVDGHAAVCAAREHGLDYARAGKLAEGGYHAVDGERIAHGAVERAHCRFHRRVEFQDIIVDTPQGFGHGGAVDHRGIGEHAYFHVGIVFVAELDCVVDHTGEFGVDGRLAVARERDYVEPVAGGLHGRKTLVEKPAHLLARWHPGGAGALRVVARLAVEAVESANFAVVGT